MAFVAGCGPGAGPGDDTFVGEDLATDLVAGDVPAGDAADARDPVDADGDASDSGATDTLRPDGLAAELPDWTDFDTPLDGDDDSVVDAADDAADDAGEDAQNPDVTADVPETTLDVPPSDIADVSDSGDGEDAGPDDVSDTVDDAGGGEPTRIRIVASNLTSGPYQSYDYGHGINILDALNPDIVLVQEFNYGDNTVADYDDFVQAVIGSGYWAVDDSTFQIPNGVVSRWPITASGYWDDPNITNRELMWATIDIPGHVDLMAISVHLHTSPSSDQVEAAQVIVARVKAHRSANPGRFMYVVGGDFNGTSAVSSDGFGRDGVFHTDPPDPVDDEDNPNTNANRNSQYDFVLGDPAMQAFQVPVVFPSRQDSISLTYPDGLVFDTRTFTQATLDEYFPNADTGDSGSSSMQHMAIVKDYLVQ